MKRKVYMMAIITAHRLEENISGVDDILAFTTREERDEYNDKLQDNALIQYFEDEIEI